MQPDRATLSNAPFADHGPGPGRRGYADAPLVVTWEVTQACDLACRHCRADARPERSWGELSTDEGRALLRQVAGFGERPPVVVFTGGDPLKRPDLFELAEYGTSLGLPMAVTPATTPLLTPAVVQRFASVGIRRMALSVDAATAERHDGFRGEAGSFEIARRAARVAGDVGLPIQVNTTVCRSTLADLPAVAELVERAGAVMWEVFFLVPVGRGTTLEALTPSEHEQVLGWLYRRSRNAPFRVITVEAPFYRRVGRQIELRQKTERRAAGESVEGHLAASAPHGSTGDANGFVFVSHRGEVYPSGFLPVAAGDVRDDDIVRIYRESELFRTLRDKDALRGKCGACEFRVICGGSRARAWAVHGDFLAEDPFCPYEPPGWEGPATAGPGARNRSMPMVG